MDRLICGKKIFTQYQYSKEHEFETHVIDHANDIFGIKSLYIDIKKRIGKDNILTIPDGYLIDFSFENDPKLFIVENELVTHDPYRHIGNQLLKFAISYKKSGHKMKAFLLENILKDKLKKKKIDDAVGKAGYRNIDDFLEDIIFRKEVAAIVIIDEVTADLENVTSQLKMKIDIIEFQTFRNGKETIRKYTPFQPEIREITENTKSKVDVERLDTIIVPANEEGFKSVFLGENCWYAIRISSAMVDRIKYIAAYQTAPVSAITYMAEVKKIEKYKDSDKYIVYFQNKARKIKAINLGVKKQGAAPQSSRYTTLDRLRKAKTLTEVWPV